MAGWVGERVTGVADSYAETCMLAVFCGFKYLVLLTGPTAQSHFDFGNICYLYIL